MPVKIKSFALFPLCSEYSVVPHIQLFEHRGLTFSWGQLLRPAVFCHCRAAKEPSQGHMWQGPAVMSICVSRESLGQFLRCGFRWLRALTVLLVSWFLAAQVHSWSLCTGSPDEWATDIDVVRLGCLALGCLHHSHYGSKDCAREHC